ncbi:MAG: oxygen-dependent coproporphyrinogen oxidase [Leptolyngbyaceae cyanobacterium SL_5_14]|nr:oxygen-dependent coproporphyrinogen oxidase [Leptolyngbyaceae cyanobacterium SL_5_14]
MVEILEKPAQEQQNLREKLENVFRNMFEDGCQAVEQLDDQKFTEHTWTRENGVWINGQSSDNTLYIDRALHQGSVFEKVGVNYVAIEGLLPPGMTFQESGALGTSEADQMIDKKGTPFFATGSSFVIHPRNPMAPTAHANYRYFQIGDGTQPEYWWFGGGADLTPAYLFEEDAVHFHQIHKEVCDKYDQSYYPRFKKNCDQYFHIAHRGESRGVGGIFFDHLKGSNLEELLAFVTDCTKALVPAYIPLVEKRKDMPFTEHHKQWQRVVRGRYVEFILTSDRGLRFGLASGMVTPKSVFNCMPAHAGWEYDDQPAPNSAEAMLREVLKTPREWV